MANFSAADVKKLRELTGAGMMDCKKALDETDGDLDKAIELLRVKGAAKAAKRGAEREATAGLVAHAPGVLVELNSETDFVAKGEDFIATAQKIADAASEAKVDDVEALKKVDARRPDRRRRGRGPRHLHRREDRARPVRPVRGRRGGVHAQARRRPAPRRRRARRVRRRRRRRPRRGDADRRDAPAVPHPRRGPGRHRRARSARSPSRPPARRASPSRRSPRSPRAGSTASSRTSSCSSSRRSPRTRRPSRPSSTRPVRR